LTIVIGFFPSLDLLVLRPQGLCEVCALWQDQAITVEASRGGDLSGQGILLVNEIKDLFRQTEETGDIPRMQLHALKPSLSELFSEGSADAETVMRAHRTYRYTLKDIGDHLGIHYATVSRIIKRFKGLAEGERCGGAKNKT